MRTIRTGFAFLTALVASAAAQTQPTTRPDAAAIAPSRITLDAENQPLSTVLAQLSQQCGGEIENNFATRGVPEPTVTLRLRDASFFQAVEAIAIAASAPVSFAPPYQANLGWAAEPSERRWSKSKFGDERGAFLLIPGSARLTRTAVPGGAPTSYLSVWFDIHAEPKVFLTEPAEFTVTRAVDSNRNALAIHPSFPPSLSVRSKSVWCNVRLTTPDQPGDRVTAFEGTLRVGVATSVKSIRVDDLLAAGPLDYDLDGVGLRLDTRREGAGFVLSATTQLREGSAVTFDDLGRRLMYPRLTDSKGAEIATTKTIVGDAKDGRQHIELRYDGRATNAPISLRLDVPLGVRPIDIPITLPTFPIP